MKMIIGGKKVPASDGGLIELINPATQQVIGAIPNATYEDVDLAITNACEGFREWSAYPLSERIKILRRFTELLIVNCEELATYITEDMGKLLVESRNCVISSKTLAETFLEHAACLNTDVLPEGNHGKAPNDISFTVRDPLGVVVAIVPFNWPVDLITHKSIPALVMGNALIVKPASVAPRACIRYVELLLEAGVPANAVQIVTGSGSRMGKWFGDDPRINCVTLTGSIEAGIDVARIAANHLHRTCLELGGNDAFIILDDADLDTAIEETIAGRISNAGQTCCASKRFIVHNSIKSEYISRLKAALKDIVPGDPKNESTQCAPLVSLEAAIDAEKQIQHSINQGAIVHFGGKRIHGAYFEPTILEVDSDADVIHDMEIFAPVITVIGFDTVDEAIEIANSSHCGLSSGVLGKNIFNLMKVARSIQAGACVINSSSLYRLMDQPFGGYKKSGLGREGGKYTLEEMSQIKTITFKKIY